MTYRPFRGQERFDDRAVRHQVLRPSLTEVVQCWCAVGQQRNRPLCNVQTTRATLYLTKTKKNMMTNRIPLWVTVLCPTHANPKESHIHVLTELHRVNSLLHVTPSLLRQTANRLTCFLAWTSASEKFLFCTLQMCLLLSGHIACFAQMWPTATDVPHSMVCLSVCWAHGWALHKWLNWSRCSLGGWHVWAQGTM